MKKEKIFKILGVIAIVMVAIEFMVEVVAEISDYLTDCSIRRLNDEFEEHITTLQDEWNEC